MHTNMGNYYHMHFNEIFGLTKLDFNVVWILCMLLSLCRT